MLCKIPAAGPACLRTHGHLPHSLVLGRSRGPNGDTRRRESQIQAPGRPRPVLPGGSGAQQKRSISASRQRRPQGAGNSPTPLIPQGSRHQPLAAPTGRRTPPAPAPRWSRVLRSAGREPGLLRRAKRRGRAQEAPPAHPLPTRRRPGEQRTHRSALLTPAVTCSWACPRDTSGQQTRCDVRALRSSSTHGRAARAPVNPRGRAAAARTAATGAKRRPHDHGWRSAHAQTRRRQCRGR